MAAVGRSTPADLRGKALDVATGELLDEDALYARLRSARVLYISESHNNPAHHALQLAILERLTAEGRHVTTLMEFLYRSRQPLIDAYLRGEVDQLMFEDQIRYGFGALFEQYRDLLRAAGANGNRLVGMNVEREIKHRYLDVGWEQLTPAEQRLIPRDLDLSNPDYRAYLRRVIEESHGSLEGLPAPMLDRFMRLQALWDETFGETIANVVRDDPSTTALVIVGNAHVRHKFTTPEKAHRRAPAPYLTVVPIETDVTRPVNLDELRRSGIADFLFFTDFPPASEPRPLAPTGVGQR